MSEHVEVLRELRNRAEMVVRSAQGSAESALPRARSAALDAAIAALSAPPEAQPVGWTACNRDCDCVGNCKAGVERPVTPPSAPVEPEGFGAWFDEYTKNNYTDEMLALAAWREALAQQPAAATVGVELPEGYRVAEHLPGIWEYQFDIQDEADEDSDRRVSGTSWNHPAIAAIAAWSHAYDALAQQPAATQDDRFLRGLADAIRYADEMEEAAGALYQQVFGAEPDGGDTGTDLLAAIARKVQQPAAVDGALWQAARSLRTIADQAGKTEGMEDMQAVRGYANSRATIAEAAITAQQGGES